MRYLSDGPQSSLSIGVICVNLEFLVIKRAAQFCTHCNLRIKYLGKPCRMAFSIIKSTRNKCMYQ